ncbi:MAG: hypothetical protein K6G81_03725 [Lachnospiraceae bacterium]|nr:hypothetical protein [Lachnospiraceae bacterium]
MQEVYWHLPGICSFFPLHQTLLRLMKEEPYRFREGYRIGSVYGTFPGAVWNGGRAVLGSASKKTITSIISAYNSFGVPVRFTWTNPLIEEKHVYDTYCNQIMEWGSLNGRTEKRGPAGNVKNQALVNSPVLEKYLREHYPDYELLSSTTKRITGLEGIKQELAGDYVLVVLDYDLNKDEEVLKALEPDAGRIELLVDEICCPHCPKRKEHYADEGLKQMTFDAESVFKCYDSKRTPSFAVSQSRPAFIGNEDLPRYIERGYINFKLVGRGLPPQMLIDSICYYLPKEDERGYVRKKLEDASRPPVRR